MKNRNKTKHIVTTTATGTLTIQSLRNAANVAITRSATPDWFPIQWSSEYWFSNFRFTHSNRWNKSYLWFYYKNDFTSKRIKVLEYE